MRATGPSKRETSGAPGLSHRDCLEVYFRHAKALWGSGTLTRRDRALLDQLRTGLRVTVTEAAKLESTAARMVATAEELAAQRDETLVGPRGKRGPWLLSWHAKTSRDVA